MRIVWADRGPRTLKYHQLLDERLAPPARRAGAAHRAAAARGRRRRGSCGPAPSACTRSPTARRSRRCCAGWRPGCPTPAGARARTTAGPAGPALGAPARAGRARGERAAAAPATVDREVVLAEGAGARDAKVRAAYDAVAATYAERLGDELDRKPFDRWLLDRVALLADGLPVSTSVPGPATSPRTSPPPAPTRPASTCRRDGGRGAPPVPAPHLLGRRPQRPPAATRRRRLGSGRRRGTRWCTSRAPSSRPPSRRSRGCSCPVAGWLWPCTPAPRCTTPRSCWTSPSTSTSSCTTPTRWSPPYARPAWSTWSGTSAARSPGEVETERLYVLGRRPA